jgi:hypothetical protein
LIDLPTNPELSLSFLRWRNWLQADFDSATSRCLVAELRPRSLTATQNDDLLNHTVPAKEPFELLDGAAAVCFDED